MANSGNYQIDGWSHAYPKFTGYQGLVLEWEQIQNPSAYTNTIKWSLKFINRKTSIGGESLSKSYTAVLDSYHLIISKTKDGNPTGIIKVNINSATPMTVYDGYIIKSGSATFNVSSTGTSDLYITLGASVDGTVKPDVLSAQIILDPITNLGAPEVSMVNKCYLDIPNLVRVRVKEKDITYKVEVSYDGGSTYTQIASASNNVIYNTIYTVPSSSVTIPSGQDHATIKLRATYNGKTTYVDVPVYKYSLSGNGIMVKNGNFIGAQFGGKYDLPSNSNQAYFNRNDYFLLKDRTSGATELPDRRCSLADYVIDYGETDGFRYVYWVSGFVEYMRSDDGTAPNSNNNEYKAREILPPPVPLPDAGINSVVSSGACTTIGWGNPTVAKYGAVGSATNNYSILNAGEWAIVRSQKGSTADPWHLNQIHWGFK